MLHGGEWLVKRYNSLAQPRGNNTLDTTLITLASRLQDVPASKEDGQPAPPLPPLQDRKAAVLTLKGLARDHPVEVGEKALGALLESLCRDAKEDDEIARAIVEACLALCETTPNAPTAGASLAGLAAAGVKDIPSKVPPHVVKHIDRFLDTAKPLHSLLPLLSPTRSFYTRFSSLQFLTLLLRIRMERVQEHVLTSPGGCGAVLGCLSEGSGSSAEIVRNEALLLLPLLVSGNADIQKLIAFEGAFEKLIDVVALEGRIEGGVVVQDALEALVALLRYNVSNQNYFRETLSVPLLGPLLFYPPPPPSDPAAQQEYANQLEAFAFQQWYPPPPPSEIDEATGQANGAPDLDEQKVINASLVIKVAGLLVEGQGESKKLNQNALLSCGFTKCLFELAFASTAPLTLKAQSLNVLSTLLQSNRSTQDQLSSLMISPLLTIDTSGGDGRAEPGYTRLPQRPAILELIGLAVNGPSQGTSSIASLALRASALSCFEAFVNDNLEARLAILKTMVSSPSEGDVEGASIGAGKLLLEGLSQFPSSSSQSRFDPYKYLISALLFAHLIRGSETAKEMARKLLFGGDGKVIGQSDEASQAKDDDDESSSLIQVLVGNFTMALREHGEATRRERGASSMNKTQVHGVQGSPTDWTRVQIGYLVVLATWFWESKLSVEEFLKESSNLQVLIQPVSQGGNMIDAIISGMCAVVLGIAYEFGPVGEKGGDDEGTVTRGAMYPILHTRIGPDQFAARLNRLRDDSRFKSTEPNILESLGAAFSIGSSRSRDTASAPSSTAAAAAATSSANVLTTAADEHEGIWFDWNFVDFIKSNHVMIQKSILVDPQSTSANEANQSTELLDAKRQFEQMKDNYAKSHREIDQLNKKVKEMDEAAKAAQQQTLQQLDAAMGENAALREELTRVNDSLLAKDQETSAGEEGSKSQIASLEAQLLQLKTSFTEKESGLKEEQAAQSKTLLEENDALRKKVEEAEARAKAAEEKQQQQQQQQEVNGTSAKSAAAGGAGGSDEEGEKTKEDLEKELEDLLILLDELSTKRKADKKRMREKGLEVSEDEEGDDDEEDDGDDDVD